MLKFAKEKFLSRKFLVLVLGVASASFGLITWDQVLNLATVWLGSQALVDASHAFKKEDPK